MPQDFPKALPVDTVEYFFKIFIFYIGTTILRNRAVIEIHNCHMRNHVGKTTVESSVLAVTNHVPESDPRGMYHVQSFYSVYNCVDHTIFLPV